VGTHVRIPTRKHDYIVNKKRKKGACVDPNVTTLTKYVHQNGRTISM
jgi:hypothetical protein